MKQMIEKEASLQPRSCSGVMSVTTRAQRTWECGTTAAFTARISRTDVLSVDMYVAILHP